MSSHDLDIIPAVFSSGVKNSTSQCSEKQNQETEITPHTVTVATAISSAVEELKPAPKRSFLDLMTWDEKKNKKVKTNDAKAPMTVDAQMFTTSAMKTEKPLNDAAFRVEIRDDEENDSDYCEYDDYEYDDDDDDGYDSGAFISESLFNIDPVNCPICFTQAESGEALTLPGCKHSFCVACLKHFIQSQIDDGKANNLACPMIQNNGTACCGVSMEQNVLREIMEPEVLERLDRYRESAFVMSSPDYHHCPTPNCTNVVYYKAGPPIVDCFRCGQVSCLKCGASPFHQGRTCEQYKEQERLRRETMRMLSQRETMRILSQRPDRSRANEVARYDFDAVTEDPSLQSLAALGIKKCRRCGNGVELSDGCLKLKCRCGYRFCYRCGSENAQCSCTPAHHGFTDNVTGRGDHAGLREGKSYT